MKIYLRNQEDKLDLHLKDLMLSKASNFNKSKLKEQISTVEIQPASHLMISIFVFLIPIKYFRHQ